MIIGSMIKANTRCTLDYITNKNSVVKLARSAKLITERCQVQLVVAEGHGHIKSSDLKITLARNQGATRNQNDTVLLN